MPPADHNFVLSPWVRRFFVIVGLVVIFGSSLLIAPDLIRPRWPWPITPFNAAFLGGVYLSELALIAVLVIANRWSPGRLVFPMAFCFVTVVTLVSVIYRDSFDQTRWTVPAWWVAYVGSIGVTGYFFLKYRRSPPTSNFAPNGRWRWLLLIQGFLMLIYGLGLLLFPATFGGFWPWKLDAAGGTLHAQVYSAVFLTGGLGSLILSNAAAAVEYLTLGVTEVALGFLSILGLGLTDAGVKKIVWSSANTWLWLSLFGAIFAAGIALIWKARRTSP